MKTCGFSEILGSSFKEGLETMLVGPLVRFKMCGNVYQDI
jgi:hypothetical protein